MTQNVIIKPTKGQLIHKETQGRANYVQEIPYS